MKIGITGTESVGKSTLITNLISLLARNYSVKALSIGEVARHSPFPLIEQQNLKSSHWILNEVKHRETALQNEADILFCDRTVLDIWVFAKLSSLKGIITSTELDLFGKEIHTCLKTYQSIFYGVIDENIPVSLSNLPNGNLEIRDKFEEVLLKGIDKFQNATVFTVLPNNLQERISLMVSRIETLMDRRD